MLGAWLPWQTNCASKVKAQHLSAKPAKRQIKAEERQRGGKEREREREGDGERERERAMEREI